MAVRSLLVLIGEVFTSSPFYWIPHLESTNLNFDGCYLGWLSLIRTLVLLKKFFFFFFFLKQCVVLLNLVIFLNRI